MAKWTTKAKITKKEIFLRALEATIKALVFYMIFILAWTYAGSLFDLVPGIGTTIQSFVLAYIGFMIIGTMTKGTIFHSVFNGATAMLILFYIISELGSNVINVTTQNVTLTLDLKLFLTISVILSLVGLATAVMEAIGFLNEKAEKDAGMLQN